MEWERNSLSQSARRMCAMKKVGLFLFVLLSVLLSGSAFAGTVGTCTFNASTNTFIVTEGPESSADHGGVDCNLKDNHLILVSGNKFFSLTEIGQKFPCSDRVDATNNHITMISDPRGPDQGQPCTKNRKKVAEVPVGTLGSGADLGTGIIAFCSSFSSKGKCLSSTPVNLIVISDTPTVPEPNSLMLLGAGFAALASWCLKFHTSIC
jgi:hypothetical protein